MDILKGFYSTPDMVITPSQEIIFCFTANKTGTNQWILAEVEKRSPCNTEEYQSGIATFATVNSRPNYFSNSSGYFPVPDMYGVNETDLNELN